MLIPKVGHEAPGLQGPIPASLHAWHLLAGKQAEAGGSPGASRPQAHTSLPTPQELIQTELHHVRTLKIMGGLFRKGMLEDLQMEPGQVHRLFPCVDELSDIHQRFLAQLLERRHTSLAPGSPKNFVINRLGDLLVQQVGGRWGAGGGGV